MSNFDALKEAIASIIKTNGNQEITGQTLQSILINMVSTLGADAAYGGVAVPSTNPGTLDKPLFYVASTEGTYTYFGNAVVNKGEIAFFSNASGTWECEKITLPAGQSYTHPAGSAASKSLGLYKISTDSTSHVKSVSAVTKSDITGLGIPEKDTTYNNATQSTAGLMSAADKAKLDSLNVDDVINVVADARALKGATMRFSGFVNGVTVTQVGVNEWDSVVYDTAVNKFLAKKNGTLSPTYHNIWSGMDAYMSDEVGTDILKDKLYLYGEDVYVWSDTEGTLVKVTSETGGGGGGTTDIPLATQSTAGLMSAEDKTKLDNVISRVVLSEFSEKKFFGEFSKVTGASAIGWAGALFIDDFSSPEYRDFYCCMTYGQGIVIRHTYKTGVYEYLNSFMVDSSTTSSTYNITNKMNSGGWGKYYDNSELPLAYISRCSPNASYIHTYYAYKINRSVTPFKFERVLTIKYGGSKLAAITSDITIDAEKKYLYVHGYKSGSADAITGTSIVMVFNLPEPGSSDTITLNDSDILWEFEFFVNEAAQDLCVSGGKLYYPYGSGSLHGLAVIDTKTGKIIQNLDLSTLSSNFIDNPEPEGVALSNGNVYLNYHHAGANSNEVCLVEFPLQDVKESIPVATTKSNGLLSSVDKEKLDSLVVLTKEEYDALEVKAENTIYFIKG